MATEKEVLKKLSEVIDPELGIDIVELGLIYGVKAHKKEKGKDQKIEIRMTFTTPACPMINFMLTQVEERLNEIKDADIEVTVVFDPPWTPDRMSKKAKLKLGIE
ncbi:TPA: metal-sulfur cluster assembly factor [Candidatus Micrarchaeota archaeon]|nr:metal-sulfur cluster assembly factor [Candidatus Micrarchaeota archaeon]